MGERASVRAEALLGHLLAEKLSAINVKSYATTPTTASTFYLDDAKEMIAASDRPRKSLSAAVPMNPASIDPFAVMARELGVTLHSPEQLKERRLMQVRSKQVERQQTLRAQIEDTLTPRKGSLAGSHSHTGSYMHKTNPAVKGLVHAGTRVSLKHAGTRISRMLRGTASFSGCVKTPIHTPGTLGKELPHQHCCSLTRLSRHRPHH